MLNSLKKQFLFLILLPVVLAFTAMAGLNYRTARQALIDEMVKSGLNYLHAGAEKMSSAVAQMTVLLRITADTLPFAQKTPAERHNILKDIRVKVGPAAAAAFIAFPDGHIDWSENKPLPATYDPRERPWYRAALRLPEGQTGGLTDVYWDNRTAGPTITAFERLSSPDGGLAGVLGIQIDITHVQRTMTARIPLPPGGIVMLVNRAGQVQIHPEKSLEGMPMDNTRETLDSTMAEAIRSGSVNHLQRVGQRRGGTWYMGFVRVPKTDLFIVLAVPGEEILAPLNRLAAQMVVVAALLTAAAFVLLVAMTRRISGPILDLKTSARRIIVEDDYARPLAVRSRDEIGQLTAAFNDMMAGLRQRDFIRDTFGRYVTQEVVQTLLESPEGLSLVGENREVTVMFADLRGFTPLSESLAPEVVVSILNRYLGRMAEIISAHKGTVNEFIGDGILALFGAPAADADSPVHAVACAVDMQLAIADINRAHTEAGLPEIHMGVGINTGTVIVGNIGSEKRAKYGVVGHHVNLAARVESVTTGGQVLITESTYRRVQETVLLREQRLMEFKGVDDTLPIYDIGGMRLPVLRALPENRFDALPLTPPVAAAICPLKGKQAGAIPVAGHLTHASPRWVRLVTDIPLPEGTVEIRIDLAADSDLPAASIYARLKSDPAESASPGVTAAQVSYMPPPAWAFLAARTGDQDANRA